MSNVERSSGESAAAVIHELRNLLAMALGETEYLLGNAGDDEVQSASLGTIRSALLRAREGLGCLSTPEASASAPRAIGVAGPSAPASAVADETTRRLRVLVVDDERQVCHTIGELLRQAGHDVEITDSGADAIARYRRARFHCVITDLAMDGLSGLAVSRAIKDVDPAAYVVLLTGWDQDLDAAEFRAAGVDEVATKPLTRNRLLELLADRRGMPLGAEGVAR